MTNRHSRPAIEALFYMMQHDPKTLLSRHNMDPDPIRQFNLWMQDAERAEIPLPNAMTLATSSRQGRPSARIVLLKEVDGSGFVFFTNYKSRKAQELQENPYAALIFDWRPISRQVRVEGKVELINSEESDQYFSSRPRNRKLGAHASPQSRVVENRAVLERRFDEISRKFDGQEVPRPEHWGGYRVIPEVVEFWQEGESRLHDRLRYRRDEAGCWILERLAP